ncbi:hypothetical protein NW766_008585 [Fusarium irregulare]|uniref:Uncharacterized protein n=1 Tax=Fusarium irregulare TaxID=2494466 RepID=A0A9W8PL48_9HYPO|nr:hypothetical protein NW766_008585 [Fusarium irregulare]
MDMSRLEELRDLAGSLIEAARLVRQKRRDEGGMIVLRTASQLISFQVVLEDLQHQGSIESSSLLMPTVEDCQKAMHEIKRLFDEITPSSVTTTDQIRLLPAWWQNDLEHVLEGLWTSANTLSTAMGGGLHSLKGITQAGVLQAEMDRKSFDILSEQVWEATAEIFGRDDRDNGEARGFTVSELSLAAEADSVNSTGFVTVCPRAHFSPKPLKELESNVEFVCCCAAAPHQSSLRYKSM